MRIARHLAFPVAVLLLLHCGCLSAQRTSFGTGALSLTAGTTLSGAGGGLSYSRYLGSSFWSAGTAFHDRTEKDIPSGEILHYPRWELRGGYSYRLLATYSRSLNVYAGGDVFIGLELLDIFRTLSPPTARSYANAGYTDIRFIYGTAPAVETELFLSPRLALVLRGRMPLTFGTPFPLIGWELGAGLKLNLP